MWTPSVDVGNKERQCHVPTSHDPLQAFPELVFRLTLVLWPAITIDLLVIADFMMPPS